MMFWKKRKKLGKEKRVGIKGKWVSERKFSTCKYIFCGLIQGHPGTILFMFVSTRGTANLTSSGYTKFRGIGTTYTIRSYTEAIVTTNLLIENGKEKHVLFSIVNTLSTPELKCISIP